MTRRIDYAPVQAPANPQAAAARAAMQAYAALMRGEPEPLEPCEDESTRRELEQAEAEARYMEACFDRWPAMRCHADTAIIEQLYDAQRDAWRDCVTVTVFVI